MKRPWPLRMLPLRLRTLAYYRFYHDFEPRFTELFRSASLALSPSITMYSLPCGDTLAGCIAFTGCYEPHLSKRVVRIAKKQGGLLIDVGANMGYYSVLWTSANPLARSIAFEPSPLNVELLKNNVARNGLSKKVVIIPKAAGHQNLDISFDPGPSDQTGWGRFESEHSLSELRIQVPMVRLEDELGDIEVEVLKIDVQGADAWVLYGCERLLKRRRIRRIFFERQPGLMSLFGIGASEPIEYLQRFGYRCKPITRGAEEWTAYL